MKNAWKYIICTIVLAGLAGGTAFAEKEKGDRPEKRDPAKAFARADADASGDISFEEFSVMHQKRVERMKERQGDRPGNGRTPPTAEEVFGRMDADGDGKVTQAEFTEHAASRKGPKGKGNAAANQP